MSSVHPLHQTNTKGHPVFAEQTSSVLKKGGPTIQNRSSLMEKPLALEYHNLLAITNLKFIWLFCNLGCCFLKWSVCWNSRFSQSSEFHGPFKANQLLSVVDCNTPGFLREIPSLVLQLPPLYGTNPVPTQVALLRACSTPRTPGQRDVSEWGAPLELIYLTGDGSKPWHLVNPKIAVNGCSSH